MITGTVERSRSLHSLGLLNVDWGDTCGLSLIELLRSSCLETRLVEELQPIHELIYAALEELARTPETADYVIQIKKEIQTWSFNDWIKIAKTFLMKDTIVPQENCGDLSTIYDNKSKCDALTILTTAGKHADCYRNVQRLAFLLKQAKINTGVVVYVDGAENNVKSNVLTAKIKELFLAQQINGMIITNSENAGYINGISAGFEQWQEGGIDIPEIVGFYDDDTFPLSADHFDIMYQSLQDDSMSAVSGLCVDGSTYGNDLKRFFGRGNEFELMQGLWQLGEKLNKPFIHGGGGGCLVKKQIFFEALQLSKQTGVLLGPAISALCASHEQKALALHQSLVMHPTKESFLKWLTVIKRYYNSWQRLRTIFPQDKSAYRSEYLINEFRTFEEIMPADTFIEYMTLKKFRSNFR